MRELLRSFVDLFASLRLTVVLLCLSIVLVFVATLDQTQLGIWAVQEKYFRSLFVMYLVGGNIPVPIFPGGYLLGSFLFLNLVAGLLVRFQWTWKKAGLIASHIGLILLLVGELFTGLMQQDYRMELAEGQTGHYAESFRDIELAVIDTTAADHDEVVAIPSAILTRDRSVQHPKLPFRVVTRAYFPNAEFGMRPADVSGFPIVADQGVGARVVARPLRVSYNDREPNQPAAFIELVGEKGSLGTWLVSPAFGSPQTFVADGRTFKLSLRLERRYMPFSVKLLKVTHETYQGSEIPRNFASRVNVADGPDQHEVLIYMNNPLRHGGLTFYQYQMNAANGRSTFQVVSNPSWVMPYIACLLMGFGLTIHFLISLTQFAKRRA